MGPCGGHLQGCHIYGKGAHRHMEFEPENVIAGCWRHHANQSPYSWHSNPMIYVAWFNAEYPARAQRLLEMSYNQKEKPDLDAIELRLTELLSAT